MKLSGLTSMSFLLEPTVTSGGDVLLRPLCREDGFNEPHYAVGEAMGEAFPWTHNEIVAAARWWRDVAANVEPEDERHVWFGGGIAFGRVHPHSGADYGIDVLVLSNPDAARPIIDYDYDHQGHVAVDDRRDPGGSYVTIDTTAEEVEQAAAWWDALRGQSKRP
ncbi:hypothetical protein [Nocardioides piscis]|uniref:Uncharacterized protein n=1 Tax=Nocardioides piscis TaxID=2714938 RepID=A0A6G7YDN4_9ACTN|nr:hypothetical protein [Nocardioides piscis]QIK74748.1 hypothetical protein G7071_04220 [Nocardioides piscis]